MFPSTSSSWSLGKSPQPSVLPPGWIWAQRAALCSPKCAQPGIKNTLREGCSSLTAAQVLPREGLSCWPGGYTRSVCWAQLQGEGRKQILSSNSQWERSFCTASLVRVLKEEQLSSPESLSKRVLCPHLHTQDWVRQPDKYTNPLCVQ